MVGTGMASLAAFEGGSWINSINSLCYLPNTEYSCGI
jgi:hypothetical protein